MRWKKPLFLVHRWVGIVLCLVFALWFLSGIFMMYVEFPQLTPPERRQGLPPLDFSSARLTPGAALARLTPADFAVAGRPDGNHPSSVSPDSPLHYTGLRLGMLLERPVYYAQVKGTAQHRAIFADTGEILTRVTPELAVSVASDFASRAHWSDAPDKITYAGQLQTDQWTVSAGLNPHRPLLKVALHDLAGTELYVSSTTAEVVRDTQRSERIWNYFAAVTHWIYPTVLRRYADLWAWVIDILATTGTVLAITGLWIGVLRWRWRRPPGKPAIPYRGWMRWHYITGALFGVLSLTWVFSGLLSMNPGAINPSRSPTKTEELTFTGKPLTPEDFQLPDPAALRNAVEARALHYDSQAFYQITSREGSSHLVGANSEAVRKPTIAALETRATALLPRSAIAKMSVLTRYDDYYYTRHPERAEKLLPVIRVEFADPQHTWFYIDPSTGEVLERSVRFNRLYRWLYNGLHSWDIRWLWERRPLWDIVVITFSLGGVCLSVLGVVVGVRRLAM